MVYKQWSINILTRNQKEVVLKMKFKKMNNYLTNFINQLLGSLRKVYYSFKGNIWGVDLADMQLINKYNKEIRYLLCAIDLFSKYVFVVFLKDRKGTTIVNAFQKILNSSTKINKTKKQIKYVLIKVVNFITLILKNG